MLGKTYEYDKMYECQHDHWWYQICNLLVIKALESNFSDLTNLSVLDAGCGTGGTMLKLKEHGVRDVVGFDLDPYPLQYCKRDGLEVRQYDLREVCNFANKKYDVVICIDVLYFLSPEERKKFLDDAYKIIKPNGLLIINVPALKVFSGNHDRAVGIGPGRFSREILHEMTNWPNFKSKSSRFWPASLSGLIFLYRYLQRNLKPRSGEDAKSDLRLNSKVINRLLWIIVRGEIILPQLLPFGSSYFLALQRNE